MPPSRAASPSRGGPPDDGRVDGHRRHRRHRRCLVGRLLPPTALLLAAAIAVACTDIPTASDHPFSIELLPPPFPAVVLGDTMRGADGVPAPLQAAVYNTSGERIEGAEVTYIITTPGASILDGGYIRGDSVVGPQGLVRVFAQAGGLQSLPREFNVVQAPDSLEQVAPEELELEYSVLPDPDLSGPLSVRVLRLDEGSTSGVAGVGYWPVHFSLVVRGVEVAPGDSSLAWLVQKDALTAATADTTAASGEAALRVRVNPYNTEGIAGLDSVEVYVSSTRPGAQLNGSPVRFVIRLRPASEP